MNGLRRVFVSPAARAGALREAVRDDSKVRVSVNGIRPSSVPPAANRRQPGDNIGSRSEPQPVVVSRAGRVMALRASVRDHSKVRVSIDGTRPAGPASERDRRKP